MKIRTRRRKRGSGFAECGKAVESVYQILGVIYSVRKVNVRRLAPIVAVLVGYSSRFYGCYCERVLVIKSEEM